MSFQNTTLFPMQWSIPTPFFKFKIFVVYTCVFKLSRNIEKMGGFPEKLVNYMSIAKKNKG